MLESEPLIRPEFQKKKRKAPVTIIIGMKCQNGIIVVCDSRTTEPTGHIRDDAQKLTVVTFADGNQAVVAEAGSAKFSSRAVEIISLLAKDRKLDHSRALADCSEEALARLKDSIRKQYHGTAEELQKHFDSFSFELMMAHYYNGKPFVFTLDFCLGIAITEKQLHTSIGCGCILANFLLSPLNISQFAVAHGIWTAVYAVEEIKRYDSRCGGLVRSALIVNKNDISKAELSSEVAMKQAMNAAVRMGQQVTEQWKALAETSIMQSIHLED
jgi:20S proteasome alpha/beta subunit